MKPRLVPAAMIGVLLAILVFGMIEQKVTMTLDFSQLRDSAEESAS